MAVSVAPLPVVSMMNCLEVAPPLGTGGVRPASRAMSQIESGDYTGAITTLAGLLGAQRDPKHALNDSGGGA